MKGSSSFTEITLPSNSSKPPRPPGKQDPNQGNAVPANSSLMKNGRHSSKLGSSNLNIGEANLSTLDVSQKKLQKKKSNVKTKSSAGGVSFKEINDVISPDMDIPLDLLRRFKPKFNEFQSRKTEFSTIQVMSYSKNNEKSTNSPKVRKPQGRPREANEAVIKINISNELNQEVVSTPAKNTAYIRKRLNEEEIELIEPLENDSYISIFKAYYNERFIILKIVEVGSHDEEAVFDEDDVVTDFQNEHDIYERLLGCESPNINNILSIYAGEREVLPEKENRLYAVMACEFGRCSMEDILRSRVCYTEGEIISIMIPLLSGLSAAHAAKVVHREIEPKNLTLSDDFKEYVICGFGRGVLLEGNSSSDRIITNEIIQKKCFLASELLEQHLKFKEFEYDPYKADVYSMGMSVLCMMGVKEDSDLEKLKTEKAKHDLLSKLEKKYPKVIPIVRKMLLSNPHDRIPSQEATALFEKLSKTAEEIDEIDYLKKYEEYLNSKTDLEAISFLEGIAQGYRMLKSYKKCLPYLEKSLLLREKTSGKNSLEVALCLDFMGTSHLGSKDYDQAIEFYKKGLGIKQSLPDSHIHTSGSYYYLGLSNMEKNEPKKAIENFSKAIELRKKGKETSEAKLDMAKLETNIGVCYSRMNNHKSAITHLTNGLNLRKQYFEKGNHLLIAESLNYIGSEYYDTGDFKTALEYFEKTLKMRRNILGEFHPDIATCHHNIGATNDGLGHHEKAVSSYELALTVFWKLDLESTSEIARTYNNLGETYNRLGDYSKSLELHYKSLKIYREIHGDIHPILIKNLLGIANSLLSLHDVDKAKLYYEDSLNMTIHIYGEKSNILEIGKAFSGLGNVFLEKGDLKKSLEFHKKSISIFQELNEDSIKTQSEEKGGSEESLGLFNLEIAMEYNNVGKIYEKAADYKEAIKHFEESLQIRKKILGNFHPEVIISLKNLANINEKLGQKSKAFELLQETLVIRRKFYGEDHALVASTLKKLAELSEKTK